MQAEGSVLTRLQERAIEGLLATDTRAAAAEYAGCSVRSVYKWLNDPIFKAALLERENILRREVGRLLATDAREARRIIKDIMLDENEESNLRMRAGQILLTFMIKTEDQSDLERRVTALEAKREK